MRTWRGARDPASVSEPAGAGGVAGLGAMAGRARIRWNRRMLRTPRRALGSGNCCLCPSSCGVCASNSPWNHLLKTGLRAPANRHGRAGCPVRRRFSRKNQGKIAFSEPLPPGLRELLPQRRVRTSRPSSAVDWKHGGYAARLPRADSREFRERMRFRRSWSSAGRKRPMEAGVENIKTTNPPETRGNGGSRLGSNSKLREQIHLWSLRLGHVVLDSVLRLGSLFLLLGFHRVEFEV